MRRGKVHIQGDYASISNIVSNIVGKGKIFHKGRLIFEK
jgi:hypothetical protein